MFQAWENTRPDGRALQNQPDADDAQKKKINLTRQNRWGLIRVSDTVTLICCVHPSNFPGLYKQIVIKKKPWRRALRLLTFILLNSMEVSKIGRKGLRPDRNVRHRTEMIRQNIGKQQTDGSGRNRTEGSETKQKCRTAERDYTNECRKRTEASEIIWNGP